jgi:hypothetical protein
MITKVSNIRVNQNHTRYIGRTRDPFHFGNPFPIGGVDPEDPNKVFTRESCILAFHDWLTGKSYKNVEPDRREWILENLETLRGHTLGCFCAPRACHGDAYRVVLGEISYDDLLEIVGARPKAASLTQNDAPFQGSLL